MNNEVNYYSVFRILKHEACSLIQIRGSILLLPLFQDRNKIIFSISAAVSEVQIKTAQFSHANLGTIAQFLKDLIN